MRKSLMGQHKDNEIERERYDRKASSSQLISEMKLGSSEVPKSLSSPYVEYERLLFKKISGKHKVLELGAGQGEHSKAVLLRGAELWALDISKNSLDNLIKRSSPRFKKQIKTLVGEMGQVDFGKGRFDFVVSAGALSYAKNEELIPKISASLKSGGYFIAVDSWNSNPIYRINRFLHVVRGTRTPSTLKNMPDSKFLNLLEDNFDVSVKFFGGLAFLLPILNKIISETAQQKFLDVSDKLIPLKFLAFKFVVVACKK